MTQSIILIALCAVVGLLLGVLIARIVVKRSVEKHPPIPEDMLRTMLIQMGQKPSTKKLNMMIKQMHKQAEQAKSR